MSKAASKPIQHHLREDNPTVIPTIQALKEGRLLPKAISNKVRQQCIEELLFDGLTVAELAVLFKCSERTIARDLVAIRKKNALRGSDLRANELLGAYLRRIDAWIAKAARAARDKGSRPGDKIEAMKVMGHLETQKMALLARLGYLKPSEACWGFPRISFTFDEGSLPDLTGPDPGECPHPDERELECHKNRPPKPLIVNNDATT